MIIQEGLGELSRGMMRLCGIYSFHIDIGSSEQQHFCVSVGKRFKYGICS